MCRGAGEEARPREVRAAYRLSLLAGRLVASLVAEFLQFFNLDFTLAVFQPETSTVRVMTFASIIGNPLCYKRVKPKLKKIGQFMASCVEIIFL